MQLLKSTAIGCLTIAGILQSNGLADEPKQSEAKPTPTLKETFKDLFDVGTALNRSMTGGQAFRRSAEEVQSDIALAKRHFNHVVAENDMKWQMIHPRPGADGYDFQPADDLVSFAHSNNMSIAGHTLVWHSQTPNWVFEGSHQPPDGQGDASNSGNRPPESLPGQAGGGGRGVPGGPGGFGGFRGFDLNGPRASRDELLERMRDHIHTVVRRFKGKVKVWDVVNEAISDDGTEVLRRSPWSVIIGPDFIAKAFEYAHEADPDAVLRYNDYGLEKPEKRKKLVQLIKSLQEQKVPISAIGSQAHSNVATTFDQMDQALTEMETLGLPIHITELDVNSAAAGQRGTGADIASNAAATQGNLVEDADKRLSEAYAGLFRAFVKHKDAIEVVTFWGVNDAVSWRSRGQPLLFDGKNQPKTAFDAVIMTAAIKTAIPNTQPPRGAISDGGRGDELASPIVDAERRITFRVKAPQANLISLTCDFQAETPMTKSAEGVWSVTVGPIDPDVYNYNFVVDGVRTIDPGNSLAKIGYYTSTLTSVLNVPGSEPAFYDVKDVPHGEIRTHIYKSNSNKVVRELNVYVPPGYDENPDGRYPVLYLLHGNANDHHSWQRYGRANEILDNLLAERSIKPMLVVMPLGYGGASINGDGHGMAASSGPNNRSTPAPSATGRGEPDLYERDILEDVIPMIDKKYRTISDPRSRAIFGFSMGGGQSGRIGLRHLDVFSHVGVMSAGAGRPGETGLVSQLATNVDETNKKLDLLWIGCGRDDFAFPGASSFAKELKEAGIKHTFVESSGGHHWRVWRRYLYEVAPKLFAAKAN